MVGLPLMVRSKITPFRWSRFLQTRFPTVTDVPNQNIAFNTASDSVSFTVGDQETPLGSLVVTATSSNKTLIPDANLVLGGNQGSRSITITPATGQSGTSTITLSIVDDEGGMTTETFVVTVASATATLDFGDAPATYPVTLAQDGARHTTGELFFGAGVDGEADGVPSVDADSDEGDDGVFVLSTFISSTVATTSSFSVIASRPGKLDGWIDFNSDGDWSDQGEQIFSSTDVIAGENLLSFSIPAGATSGNTGARFRLSTVGGLAPTGASTDGEVEDYLATIVAGAADTVLNIAIPVGDTESGRTASFSVEGTDLVVKKNNIVLFRAPFESFGNLSLNGSSIDDILQLTILEALATRTLEFDGGLGKDFLELVATGQTLDLTNASVTIREVEGIDIRGTGSNRLVISIDAVKAASSTTDTLEVVSNAGDTITFGDGWKAEAPRFINGQFSHVITETTEGGTARVEVRNDRPLTNPLTPFDVDRSGRIQPLDALRIINEISRRGSGAIAIPTNDAEANRFYFDVSGDMQLTAADALRVINALSRINRGLSASGESAPAIAFSPS
jgi:hypothetical protein